MAGAKTCAFYTEKNPFLWCAVPVIVGSHFFIHVKQMQKIVEILFFFFCFCLQCCMAVAIRLVLVLFPEYIREMQVWGNCRFDFDLLGLPAFPCLRATAESRDLVWYVFSVSSYGEWSKQFLQTLSCLDVLMICLPDASFSNCLWDNKNAAHLSDRRLL